jgi:hypothetical protein
MMGVLSTCLGVRLSLGGSLASVVRFRFTGRNKVRSSVLKGKWEPAKIHKIHVEVK